MSIKKIHPLLIILDRKYLIAIAFSVGLLNKLTRKQIPLCLLKNESTKEEFSNTYSHFLFSSKTFVLEDQSPSVYYILLPVFLRTNYSSTGILTYIYKKNNL